jgi:hypothetical protein
MPESDHADDVGSVKPLPVVDAYAAPPGFSRRRPPRRWRALWHLLPTDRRLGPVALSEWLAFDAIAADADPASGARDRPPALAWLDLHTAKTRELQLRHPDGHIYEPG